MSLGFVGPIQFVPIVSPDQLWQTTAGVPIVQGKQSFIHPTSYTPLALDEAKLLEGLSKAPLEFTDLAQSSAVTLNLPKPDGSFASFKVVSSPIMAPELAAQFPEIQTYSGQGIDDPSATLRFDVTPAGFHAQILSPAGAYYIDPFWHLDHSAYISYFKRDLVMTPDRQFIENQESKATSGLVFEAEMGAVVSKGMSSSPPTLQVPVVPKGMSSSPPTLQVPAVPKGMSSSPPILQEPVVSKGISSSPPILQGPEVPAQSRSGTQLRVYELANAATSEYTVFHGNTVALGQAAIVTAINRVTGIYENELSIRLVLVGNNSSLVYTNSATDPYSNDVGASLLAENQANIDTVIGNANYDLGHVFSTGGGGLASLGVVGVTGSKARGETGLPNPVADAFYVDYVAHEMGHQFGGNHTFNSSTGNCLSNRAATAAYEPGSGSTIQAYAGICGSDNLQTHSDPYFHSVSFDEIIGTVSGGAGNAAATLVATGNSVPRINAGPDYAIPAQTPFVLKAAGADADSTDVLTYNWEQRDLGVTTTLAAADNGTSPLFRSFTPTTSTNRTFPRLTELLNNTTPVGEKLPTLARAMDFRATVRDNRAGGGAVNTDDMIVTVVNTGAAFAVTSPNTTVSWASGSTQTVTWNVAGTTAAPINTSAVNIWLSTDGGQTFPQLLAANVANDGSESVTIPNLATTQARIKVEPTNSIYFDLSNANFTITGGTNSAPTISTLINRVIDYNSTTGSLAFTVGDAQTLAQNLVVTATSNNSTLLPAGGIVLGGSGANRTLTLTPSPAQFGTATVLVNVTDAGGLTTTTSFQLYVEGVLACTTIESFDGVTAPGLPAGWTSSATGAGAANWTTSATGSDAGSNNAFVTDPGNVSDSLLTSPPIPITSANRVFQFRNNFNLEASFDGGVLEISVDGGAFTDLLAAGGLFQSGGYVATISSGFANPISGRSAWTGSSGGYITTVVELPTSTVGHNVRLRFRMASDNSTGAIGWRVDTIQSCGFTAPSLLSITATDASKNEGNVGSTAFNFVVTRTNDASSAISVQYAVTGSTASPATASDFGGTLPSGTVSFAVGETSKSLPINVAGDTQYEGNEGFIVTLSSATGGAVIDTATANGLIIDDDNVAPTNLSISQNTIAENSPVGSTVGNLSTTDSDVGDLFIYSLVSGTGDTDNSKFAISGSTLRTATALNFETGSSYSVRVRSTDRGGLVFEKSLTIQVADLPELSAPVVIGDGTAQRSLVNKLIVTFDGAVTIAAGAFLVDKLGLDGGSVTTNPTATVNGTGQTIVTLSFSGTQTRGAALALSDGYYRLTIDGTKITRAGRQLDANGDGIAGDTYTLGAVESDNFFALYGDTSGDGIVGVVEYGQFRSTYAKTDVDFGFDPRFDYESDNLVAVTDFGQFRARYGKIKPPF